MSNQNQELMNDLLIPGEQSEHILTVDKLYARSYSHFDLVVVISGIYSLAKVCAAPIFIALCSPDQVVQIAWLSVLIPISLMQALYYWRLRRFASNLEIFLRVGERVRHAAYCTYDSLSPQVRETHVHEQINNFRNQTAGEPQDKEVKILALEIKYDVLKQDCFLNVVSKVLFTVYMGIHIWGYFIFSQTENPTPAEFLILVVLFLGTYQHLEAYLGIAGVIIAIPFFLVYMLVLAIKNWRKGSRLVRILKSTKYNPMQLKGDHMCHICMEDYKENDDLTVLVCNQMHHFHHKCLSEWVRVSGTCPLCRVQVQDQ